MINQKLIPGSSFPEITLPRVGGGDLKIGGKGKWQLIVVYRGRHCPLCKLYLNKLEDLLNDFDKLGIEIIAISSDSEEKADADMSEFSWGFDVGYNLKPYEMDILGLYISDPRSPEETDRKFPEPALFVIRPDGLIQIIDISNSPVARTDLKDLPDSLKWIIDNDYPIRGTGKI